MRSIQAFAVDPLEALHVADLVVRAATADMQSVIDGHGGEGVFAREIQTRIPWTRRLLPDDCRRFGGELLSAVVDIGVDAPAAERLMPIVRRWKIAVAWKGDSVAYVLRFADEAHPSAGNAEQQRSDPAGGRER